MSRPERGPLAPRVMKPEMPEALAVALNLRDELKFWEAARLGKGDIEKQVDFIGFNIGQLRYIVQHWVSVWFEDQAIVLEMRKAAEGAIALGRSIYEDVDVEVMMGELEQSVSLGRGIPESHLLDLSGVEERAADLIRKYIRAEFRYLRDRGMEVWQS
jgi:hypothetical protein